MRTQLRRLREVGQHLLARPWSSWRTVSNSYAAKATILIPLIGYLIILNANIVQWLNLITDLPESEGHAPIRLLLLYLGLCNIALAAGIYGYACPAEIKKYADVSDYIIGDGPAIGAQRLNETIDYLEREGYYELRDGAQALNFPEKKIEVLRVYYRERDRLHPLARIATCVFYGAGFGILGCLSLRVFYRAMSILFHAV